MDFDKYFDTLNEFTDADKKEVYEGNECCKIVDNYIMHNGMTTCKECSTVISNVSDSPEWRYYGCNDSKSSDPTRCGMPTNVLLPQSSIGSTVNFKNNSKSMNQIRRYQNFHGMPYKERSKYKVFNIIAQKCANHNINQKIVNEAKSLYSNISEIKISRGSNRDGIIAACVYFACKECDVPRSSKEIADIFDINITVMTKGCKNFNEIMNLNKSNKTRVQNKSINPNDFIERFSDTLNVDISKVKNICKISMDKNIISQNTPQSIASGCIYYYVKKMNLDITKKDLSNICKISEVTINKCYKKILDHDELFNKYFEN
jgi:transcription initiation factor TFIIIB Brf1 subunit/transcription initiation factor TFIIB